MAHRVSVLQDMLLDNTSEGMEATSELAEDSIESRLGDIISAIKSLAQHAINTNDGSPSQQSLNPLNATLAFSQSNAITESFDRAMRAIRSETYRAAGQVDDALRVSQVSHLSGPVQGPITLPGIDRDHELNKLLNLVFTEGKNFYRLADTNPNMPSIIVDQEDGLAPLSKPPGTILLLPTSRNVKILQHAYGRALKHKVDLIQSYITAAGTDSAMAAPKRHKPAHENDSMTALPKKYKFGPFIDMKTVEIDGIMKEKTGTSELVLAFLLPSGDCQYVEVTSGNTKEKAAVKSDLVVPVSDDAIKLLYELYGELKELIARRMATAGAQGPAQAQAAHDPTDVALFRRMRDTTLGDEDDNGPGSKRVKTSK
ncbi:uncharacterized protein PG986_006885 [Apiospora aurea]|uniref:Uncharacterized protein n=1 Tax=Apiospora aurea TaxID=335848 RepID=A0ABR1QB12_9PEZI